MSLSFHNSLFVAVVVCALSLITPLTTHAASTCTDTYTKDASVPTGYGAAYNLFSSAKELLVKTNSCTDTTASVTIGNGDAGTYIYKDGYYWNNTAWVQTAFTSSSALVSNLWYTSSANDTIPLATGNSSRYYVGYTCQQVSGVWKCGCHDTTCTTGAWQLQKTNKTTTTTGGGGGSGGGGGGGTPVCGNNICEASETTQSCAQDCPASHAGERGRVHVANNIVLTDRNTPLRGATIGILTSGGVANDAAYWKYLHDMGINAVRLGVKTITSGRTVSQQIPFIDRAVDLAGQNHMYVMINNSVEPGNYNLQELKTFWTAVAPRYKNRTHVFYEMTNEPVGWWPRSYTAQNIADFKSVYDIMRNAAPDTHIVLFDFPNIVPDSPASVIAKIGSMQGIDYTKASVAWHHYVDKTNSIEQTVTAVQQHYPLLMTETNYWIDDPPSRATTVNTLRMEEKLGVGWFSLDGKGSATHLEKEIIPNLHAAGYNWAIEN